MHKEISTEAFETESIPKLVIRNAVPALIAMVMVMVYNLADTFFIGLTHDDFQVAAVSLASPVFMIFMSLGTLFGVGGTSVVSRAIGAGQTERVKQTSAFCTWCCVGIGVLLMALLWACTDTLAGMLGASEETMEYTLSYLRITIGCGVFSMLSNCFSNLIRAEGKAMTAMTGTVIGNLLNMILDPIMILGFKWGITGAAVATVIGTVVGAGYYFLYFARRKTMLSISPKRFSGRNGIAKDVVAIGLSASLANLLVSISSILANKQMSAYGDMYVAGYGVTAKVILVVSLIGIGMGAGVQPLFGYYYGAKNRKRLTESIRFAALFSTGVCLLLAVLCFAFAAPIVGVFLTDGSAYAAGIHFTRIFLSSAWLIGVFIVCQNGLQAMGAAVPALLASLFRQAVLFIPAMFLMKAAIGMDGIAWAQPVADVLSLLIILPMLRRKMNA